MPGCLLLWLLLPTSLLPTRPLPIFFATSRFALWGGDIFRCEFDDVEGLDDDRDFMFDDDRGPMGSTTTATLCSTTTAALFYAIKLDDRDPRGDV